MNINVIHGMAFIKKLTAVPLVEAVFSMMSFTNGKAKKKITKAMISINTPMKAPACPRLLLITKIFPHVS